MAVQKVVSMGCEMVGRKAGLMAEWLADWMVFLTVVLMADWTVVALAD